MENYRMAWRCFALVVFVSGISCQKVCLGPLGCFTNEPPFTSALLPEPLLPEGRDVIDVTYSLFVRHSAHDVTATNKAFTSVNVTGPHVLRYNEGLTRKWKSRFSVTKQTKMIIHDYYDTASNAWVFAMVERFLAADDCHVITVGWQSRDGAGGYYLAAANARVVGAEVALLLRNIQEWKSGFEFASVHLIGHGLGAHAASYVGETLKVDDEECMTQQVPNDGINGHDDVTDDWWQLPSWLRSSKKKEEPEPVVCSKLPKLGQITGLDPAGLWFETAGAKAKLDSSDAIFVDVIHTDVIKKLTTYFGHGISEASGNIDFYPNGGSDQPGCEQGLTGLDGLNYPGTIPPSRPMDCNHARAITYYLSTMTTNSCSMTSFPCDSWAEMYKGKCASCVYDFEADHSRHSSFSPSAWLSYLSAGNRRRRTSAPSCLKLGTTANDYWREHKRRAKAAKRDVTNIQAYLKTSSLAPFCVKYVRIELELDEAWSAGSLSFRFTDQTNRRSAMMKAGRVSNWGSTTRPVYLLSVEPTFGRLVEVDVLWEMTVVTSWWPGIGGIAQSKSDTRKEIRLPLKKIIITEPPLTEITNFCSPRRRLKAGREARFTPCESEAYNHDYENYVEDEE